MPELGAVVPPRCRRTKTVASAFHQNGRIREILGLLTVLVLLQYLSQRAASGSLTGSEHSGQIHLALVLQWYLLLTVSIPRLVSRPVSCARSKGGLED
jgi:hypothetical protein